ncbi:hypothetical protein PENTCL1PPCAC_7553, partial [Pristionchus entomophagus]
RNLSKISSTNEAPKEDRKTMKSLHRGGLLEISLVFTAFILLLPHSEAFFFNFPGLSVCGGCPPPPPVCCSLPSLQPRGFGSQLFSSYGVGRMFAPAASYAVAPAAGNAYPTPPSVHPWVAQMVQHATAANQHWHGQQVQYPMSPYASIPDQSQLVASSELYNGYQSSSTPSATTSIEEASFFGDNRVEETSTPAYPFSEQIDEQPTTYSTDQTQEPLRESPSGYTFTAAPAPPPPDAAPEPPIQVESASPQTEIAGSYLRSKPPKVLQPPATQAVDEFSETATWAPASTRAWTAPAAADTRTPVLAFSVDERPATVQLPAVAAAPAATPPQPQTPESTDLSSSELKELDDLDMLLITSDESFRPVTSQNPARPLTSEERAGFPSNDISTIADGLPPNLSDVIFWPIGKDITLLKRAIALRRRRDEEARKRMHRSREGSDPASVQKYRSQSPRTRLPTTDERVSSFLAHYLRRRRAPSGDSRRAVFSGGQSERPPKRFRSAKTARDILRSSILEKILAMEELLSE